MAAGTQPGPGDLAPLWKGDIEGALDCTISVNICLGVYVGTPRCPQAQGCSLLLLIGV